VCVVFLLGGVFGLGGSGGCGGGGGGRLVGGVIGGCFWGVEAGGVWMWGGGGGLVGVMSVWVGVFSLWGGLGVLDSFWGGDDLLCGVGGSVLVGVVYLGGGVWVVFWGGGGEVFCGGLFLGGFGGAGWFLLRGGGFWGVSSFWEGYY